MLDIERRINSKEQLIEWLEYEKRKYGGAGTFFSVSEGPILYRHQKLLRKTEFYFNTGKMARYRIYNYLLKRIQNKYCLRIPLNCCDRGLKIMHLAPVLVNPNAIIGKDCSFHMNSGLVAAGKDDAAPTLGDGVVVGIGAIIRGVNISSKIVIGANAVVTRDFSEVDIAIAGVPAQKVRNTGRSALEAN